MWLQHFITLLVYSLLQCTTSDDIYRKVNGPYITDAVGNFLPPPKNLPAKVGSPSNLLTPEKYEFYTFDDSGELVKRLMTLEEIQEIVAAGDGNEGHLVTLTDNFDPMMAVKLPDASSSKVQNVVTNVQNVLKAQMEANKNKPPIPPTTFDTPDVSDTWSLILPTIFGNTGLDILPDKPPNSFSTPETETIEVTKPDQLSNKYDDLALSKEEEDYVKLANKKKSTSTTTSTTTTSKTSKPTTKQTTAKSTSANTRKTTKIPVTHASTSKPYFSPYTQSTVTTKTDITNSVKPTYITSTPKVFITSNSQPTHVYSTASKKPQHSTTHRSILSSTVEQPSSLPYSSTQAATVTTEKIPKSSSKQTPQPVKSTTSIQAIVTRGVVTSTKNPSTISTQQSYLPLVISTIPTTSTLSTLSSIQVPMSTKATTLRPILTSKYTTKISSTTVKPPISTSQASVTKKAIINNTDRVSIQNIQNLTEYILQNDSPAFDMVQSLSQIATDLENSPMVPSKFTTQNYTSSTGKPSTSTESIKNTSIFQLTSNSSPTTKTTVKQQTTATKSTVKPNLTTSPAKISTAKYESTSTTTPKLISSKKPESPQNVLPDSLPEFSDFNSLLDLSGSMSDLLSQVVDNRPSGIILNEAQLTTTESILERNDDIDLMATKFLPKEGLPQMTTKFMSKTTEKSVANIPLTHNKLNIEDIKSNISNGHVVNSLSSVPSKLENSILNKTTFKSTTKPTYKTTPHFQTSKKDISSIKAEKSTTTLGSKVSKYTTPMTPTIPSSTTLQSISTKNNTFRVTSTTSATKTKSRGTTISTTNHPTTPKTTFKQSPSSPTTLKSISPAKTNSPNNTTTKTSVTTPPIRKSTEFLYSSFSTSTSPRNIIEKQSSSKPISTYPNTLSTDQTKASTTTKRTTSFTLKNSESTVKTEDNTFVKSTTAKISNLKPADNIKEVNYSTTVATLSSSETHTTPKPTESTTTTLQFKKDETKKKVQKVNIDIKEQLENANVSWKLISTVTPPHPLNNSKYNEQQNEYFNEPNKLINLDSSKENQGLEDSTHNLNDDLRLFAELSNELAFKYWEYLLEETDAKRSFVISPFAVTSMLGMIFMGARGATSGEMNEILKLDDMVTFNPHFVFKNISDSIDNTPDSGVITSAFVRELYTDRNSGKILSFYKERAHQFYGGHVEEANFKSISDIIRRRTNLLVKRHSWGRITEFIKSNSLFMHPPLATFSVNIFQTDCTGLSTEGRDGEMYFVVSPSVRQRRLVPVPAVVYKNNFLAGYDPVLDATAAAIGNESNIVSTIFLMPGQQGNAVHSNDLDDLQKRFLQVSTTSHSWNGLLRTLLPRMGLELQVPRFSHTSLLNISTVLQKMGMKDLFDSKKADLGGISGPSKVLYVSDMIQSNSFTTCGEIPIGDQHHSEIHPGEQLRKKRSFRLSEGWNEPRDYQRAFHDPNDIGASALLPLHLRPRQARLPARSSQSNIARLKFDRPFLYFVRHNPTGMILYIGRFNPRLLP